MIRGFCLWLPLGLALLSGCSGTSSAVLVPCHPAKGSLAIGDKPAIGATIIFVPKNELPDSKTPRPRGTVGDDGTFQVSTFGTNDGAPVGEYGLIIFWPGDDSDDRLNGRCDAPSKTKQTVKIAEGQNDLPPIKLK